MQLFRQPLLKPETSCGKFSTSAPASVPKCAAVGSKLQSELRHIRRGLANDVSAAVAVARQKVQESLELGCILELRSNTVLPVALVRNEAQTSKLRVSAPYAPQAADDLGISQGR